MNRNVLVPLLTINITVLGPSLIFVTHDLEDSCLFVLGIEIDTTEMIPVVFLLAVLALTTGEVKSNPLERP